MYIDICLVNNSLKNSYHLTYGHPSINTPFGSRYVINADVTASGYPNESIENYIQNQILPYYNNTHSNAYTGRFNVTLYPSRPKVHQEINQCP